MGTLWDGGRLMLLAVLVLAALSGITGAAVAQEEEAGPSGGSPASGDASFGTPEGVEEAVPGRVIVKFEEGATPAEVADVRRDEGLEKKEDLGLIEAEVAEVNGQSVERAVDDLNRRPDVEYAEPDYKLYPTGYADEPRFPELWGLDNTGQTIDTDQIDPVPGSTGVRDVDINALEASAVTQGDPNLVVAVIDDGTDFLHPDLAGRQWVNPGESGGGREGNGVDDDGNGYVDDVNGWDFRNHDNTVYDPGKGTHGTHVAGTIAASVNGEGVAGVAPNVKIMALKFLEESGSVSDAVAAVEYATDKGARISNNSWGGGPPSQALEDAIRVSGQLFVASAGNDGQDNDATPSYPASYDLPNILSVAAVDNKGNLAGFSNYGKTSVDISAPGVAILSSIGREPQVPGLATSYVRNGEAFGAALVAGFGAEEIIGASRRASFMKKALAAVEREERPVVLVDDDGDNAGRSDVAPPLSAAIESATGAAPQVITVPPEGDGPALAELSGKTVVWATGRAYDSGAAGTTLTAADQQTLREFLAAEGRLVLTGMDALRGIETSSFVIDFLKLEVRSDLDGKTALGGVQGRFFAGESYSLTHPVSIATQHDMVSQKGPDTETQGFYPGSAASWAYFNGTSMAAPHATGAAALAASLNPAILADPAAFRRLMMDSGKALPEGASNPPTTSNTVSGKMIDARAALGRADAAAPMARIVSPPRGSRTVPASAGVVVAFSEAMDRATVNGSTFFLKKGSTVVRARVTLDAAGKKATLDPAARLTPGATYTATVKGGTGGGEDLVGKPLTRSLTWSFSVNSAPTITPVSPTPGSTVAGPSPRIRAIVRDAQDTLSKAGIKVYVDGRARRFAYDERGVVELASRLPVGRHTVKIVATDPQGLSATKNWSFVTR